MCDLSCFFGIIFGVPLIFIQVSIAFAIQVIIALLGGDAQSPI